MKLWTIIALPGITIVAFVCGRITAPQADVAETSVSPTRNPASAASGAPIKSIAALRGELKKLPYSRFQHLAERSSRESFRLQNLLDRLDMNGLVALVKEYERATLTPNDLRGVGMLFEAMSKKDPEAAWKLAATLQPPMRNPALLAAITGFAQGDPDSALAKLDGVHDDHLRRSLRKSLLTELSENDPSRAFSLLDAESLKDKRLVQTILDKWISRDMPAALAGFVQLDESSRALAADSVASALANIDPAAAWEFALANTKFSGNIELWDHGVHGQIFEQWAQRDPQAAIQAALELQDDKLRSNLFTSAFSSWSSKDYDSAFRYVMEATDSEILCNGIRALSMGIPLKEGDHAKLLDAFMERGNVDRNLWHSALSQLLSRWAQDDPRGVGMAVAQLPPGSEYRDAVISLAQSWPRNGDIDYPLQWALSLRDGDSRSEAIRFVLSSTVRENPHRAIEILKTNSLLDNALVVGNIALQWSSSDMRAATEWVKTLTNDDARNQALDYMATFSVEKSTPETSISLALAINNPDKRMETLESIMRQWKRFNPQAAEAWVRFSNLPEASKNRLLGK